MTRLATPAGGAHPVCTMSVLVDNEHFHIERDERLRRVTLRRTDSKFALADVDAVFAPVAAALAGVDGDDLLLDMRRAPPRPEDGFEAAMNKHLAPLMVRFRRRAVLVRSAVGVLQVSRVSKRMGSTDDDTAVFQGDEAGALDWLARR